MATDMKYYKDLLKGVGGFSLGASMGKAVTGKGASSLIAAAAGASAMRKAASKLPKGKKNKGK